MKDWRALKLAQARAINQIQGQKRSSPKIGGWARLLDDGLTA
jgi:hypothetical protein